MTGGAVRIGRAIALELARLGFDIALHCATSRQAAGTTAAEISALGRRCAVYACDLSDLDAVIALSEQVGQAHSDWSLLVNNASIFEPGRLRETHPDLYDRLFAINLRAPFFLSRDFARHRGRGQIINILDTKVARLPVNHFAYTLTKKALAEMTRMAARELAPHIRVNAVCPGLVLPPPGEDETYLRRMAPHVPLQRRGFPEEIAAAVRFLVENEFITGEILFVDGGEHLE